jgi:hypothetical protein
LLARIGFNDLKVGCKTSFNLIISIDECKLRRGVAKT